MIDYSGIPCPVCGEKFDALDDIVVCPECGAPYHRECYQKAGHCVFEDRHATGEAWKPPVQHQEQTQAHQENSQRTKACPRCSTKNFPDALFCDKCGLPLTSNTPPVNNPYGVPNGAPGQGFPGPMGGMPFVMDPMGGVPAEEPMNDEVTAGEVAKYVKVNTPYYMQVFKRLKDSNKGKFNFCAFLFTGGWLLYRKQYKYGVFITLLMFALIIGSTCVSVYLSYPILNQLATQAKVDLSTANLYSLPVMAKLVEQIYTLTFGQLWILITPSLMDLARWVVMFFVGLRGNRMYWNHCLRTTAAIKKEAINEEECTIKLQSAGGVNTAIALCLMVCYMIISMLPFFLTVGA